MKALEAGLAFSIFISPFQEDVASKKTIAGDTQVVNVVAHRGASGYAPENTIASFDKAVTMGADYIEIDVQRSKDGELVVIHDHMVDRTTNGTGHVRDLTIDELKTLDAGSWKGPEFAGERIPTFDEVLDRYHGRIGILVELKAPELYPGIEEEIAATLMEHNLDHSQSEEVIIQSFHFESMKKMNKLLPNMPIGVLTASLEHTSNEALNVFSNYADYFNPQYGLVSQELVERAHSYGLKVGSWTVRSQEVAESLIAAGVDAIITDYPDYVNVR